MPLHGMRDVYRSLDRSALPSVAERSLAETGEAARRELAAASPTRTGTLARSWEVRPGALSVEVASDLVYARFVQRDDSRVRAVIDDGGHALATAVHTHLRGA